MPVKSTKYRFLKTTKNNPNASKVTHNAQQTLNIIIDSILEKKGIDVVSLDLSNLQDAMAAYFVICEGNSPPQVRAIADNVLEKVKQLTGQIPAAREGFGSLEWVLLDYLDIVVHVFHKNKRHVYQLEELWGDAAITTTYNPDGTQLIHKDHRISLPKAE